MEYKPRDLTLEQARGRMDLFRAQVTNPYDGELYIIARLHGGVMDLDGHRNPRDIAFESLGEEGKIRVNYDDCKSWPVLGTKPKQAVGFANVPTREAKESELVVARA